jgi:hypothetical protein
MRRSSIEINKLSMSLTISLDPVNVSTDELRDISTDLIVNLGRDSHLPPSLAPVPGELRTVSGIHKKVTVGRIVGW